MVASSLVLFSTLVVQDGQPIFGRDAYLTTLIAGLERTGAKATVQGPDLIVKVGKSSEETNATQLTIRNALAVASGDVMMAEFLVRSGTAKPARVEFLFERAESPWTKSVTQGVEAGSKWKRVLIPFRSAESYRPGEAMASLRLAFGPQTVMVRDLIVKNWQGVRTWEQLQSQALNANSLGSVKVRVNPAQRRQTLMGFGGNFCQPRYGSTEPMDRVGQYVLDHLDVVHARIGLPLNHWTPERGVYRNAGQARASLLALKEMKRRGIPTVLSVWEGPGWMLGGRPEQTGRTLPKERYSDCIEAIARYLLTAREEFGVSPEYFSFNEPDYGVNFKFTSREMANFIRRAGKRFAELRLKTKFLVADTANGGAFYAYARPLLEDRSIAPYLGPLAFHSWDALSVPEAAYRRIAELGRKYKKPVWCLEAGHDAQLWQAKDPWGTWENGLRTAQAYARTMTLSEASLMDWTYQDNYPLVDSRTEQPFPVFQVMKQMEEALPKGGQVVGVASSSPEVATLAVSGPKRGTTGVLLVNPIGQGQVTLAGLTPGSAVRIVTSDRAGQGRSDRMMRRVGADGSVLVRMPTQSVVTVLVGR